MWNRKVFIRIIEVLLCVGCVVALRVTDDESRRVFHYLRNRSREWSLLNNVTWGSIGAALATVACGGYVIVTAGLLVAAATGELRGRKTELFLLGLGIILFGIVGALSLASIESVPEDLIDNAAVLGGLCLLTALVFIADLLMTQPRKKTKQEAIQTFVGKDTAKRSTTTLTTETEAKEKKRKDATSAAEAKSAGGTINDGFDKTDDQHRTDSDQDQLDGDDRPDHDREPRHRRSNDVHEAERNRKFDHVERELREYKQNFENGRALRNSQRHRDEEALQRSHGRGDNYESDRRIDESRIVYRTQDIYQRPVDEVDTPPFPTNLDKRGEPVFAKIVNPGVKIMRVERDIDDGYDAYRYSDTSQYDNVPIRMRSASPGILKKSRDVTFNVPPPPKSYGKEQEASRDEIEMLEECFGALRTTSTGTQTNVRTPSSPTDPGYVKHTASNWPQDSKMKSSAASSDHGKSQ